MHKRDVAILLLACVAMVVSLQRESTFSFRKAWFHDHESDGDDPLVEHHLLPAPVVADLNGDGQLEVVLTSPGLMLKVLSPVAPSSVTSGFGAARVIKEVSLLRGKILASAARRPVALAVGFLDPPPPPGTLAASSRRKQVIVIITAGLHVLCYDHNLGLLWERDMGANLLQRHTSVHEAAVMVTPHQVDKLDRGLVIVGLSLTRGDLTSGEGLETGGPPGQAVDDEDVLAVKAMSEAAQAAHAHSAAKDAPLEDVTVGAGGEEGDAGTTGLDTSRHFSYHGLEGQQGAQRWAHTATDFHKDLEELAAGMRPQHDYRLDAGKLEGRHFGQASCRDYRESLLHYALPHLWDGPLDTRIVEGHFAKHRVGLGADKIQLAARDGKGRPRHATASVGHHEAGAPPPHGGLLSHVFGGAHAARAAAARSGGRVGAAAAAANASRAGANAVVVHLQEGLEVVHAFSGRTICQLHLPPHELHADINGDGVMDHVQVYRGAAAATGSGAAALAGEVGGRRHRGASPCTALATSGVPPLHVLWKANVCRSSRFLSGLRIAGKSGAGDAAEGVELLTPVFLPLPRHAQGHARRGHSAGLVLVLNSQGELHALSSRGAMVWQATFPVDWTPQHATETDAGEAAAEAAVVPTLRAVALHAHGVPSAVLAAGEGAAVLVSEHGTVLASVALPSPPVQPLVVADYTGDGLNDVIAVTRAGVFGYAQTRHVGGGTLSTLLAVATGAMALLLWSHQTGGGTAGGTPKPRLRSTEYTD